MSVFLGKIIILNIIDETIGSFSGIVFTSLFYEMAFPPLFARVNIQMAQWASISGCWRFGRYALLLLDMSFISTLMHSFFAPGTLLEILAILTLSH